MSTTPDPLRAELERLAEVFERMQRSASEPGRVIDCGTFAEGCEINARAIRAVLNRVQVEKP